MKWYTLIVRDKRYGDCPGGRYDTLESAKKHLRTMSAGTEYLITKHTYDNGYERMDVEHGVL